MRNSEIVPETDGGLLSQRFRPALMAFFLRRIRNHAEAEDLTQDVLMKIAQQGLGSVQRPEAYVFQMAANLLRDRGRRLKVRQTYQRGLGQVAAMETEERDPDRVLQSRESLSTVLRALNRLPERTRTIFVLFRLENMKQREIADMLGVSLRTVEQHVIQASAVLRRAWESSNDTRG